MKTVTTTTWIDASPAAVWAVLTDLVRYPEWNPLFREGSGEIAVGSTITLKSFPAAGRPMTVKPKITAVTPAAELRWAASLPGIMGGEHSFTLKPGNGGTLMVQSETFRGILVPFSGKALARAEASFRALNEALKTRIEAG